MARTATRSRLRRRVEPPPGRRSAAGRMVLALAAVAVAGGSLAFLSARRPDKVAPPASARPAAPAADTPVRAPEGGQPSAPEAVIAPPDRRYSVDDVAPGFENYVPESTPVEPRVIAPRDGAPGFTYRVPRPGDPDYEDYLKMLRHPLFARFNRPGVPQWYDPEWRAVVTGRREVPVNDLQLVDAWPGMEDLLETVLEALAGGERDALNYLRVHRDEFELLCWPEFHQSRPINRIPSGEAWSFHFTKMNEGTSRTFNDYGNRNFSLVDFRTGAVDEYTNFRLIHGVAFTVEDNETGETLVLDVVDTVIACRGRYKIYTFKG